jgi:hypothetical protein
MCVHVCVCVHARVCMLRTCWRATHVRASPGPGPSAGLGMFARHQQQDCTQHAFDACTAAAERTADWLRERHARPHTRVRSHVATILRTSSQLSRRTVSMPCERDEGRGGEVRAGQHNHTKGPAASAVPALPSGCLVVLQQHQHASASPTLPAFALPCNSTPPPPPTHTHDSSHLAVHLVPFVGL